MKSTKSRKSKKVRENEIRLKKRYSIIMILISIFMMTGTTIAYFSDTVKTDIVAKSGTVSLKEIVLLMEQDPNGNDLDYDTNMLETGVLNWNPGDVNTIEWTVENKGNKSAYTRNTLEIAWNTQSDLEETNVVYLYPANMSDADIRTDINDNNASLAINVGEDNKNIIVNDTEDIIKGYQFTFLGDVLDGIGTASETGNAREENLSAPLYQENDGSNIRDNIRFKLAFAWSASDDYQDMPLYVKVNSEAIQFRNNPTPDLNFTDTYNDPYGLTLKTVTSADELNWLFPEYVTTKGWTKTTVDDNEVLLLSNGSHYLYNSVYSDEMVGKNVTMSVEINKELATEQRGSTKGIFFQFRKYKEGDLDGASTTTLTEKLYYGVSYSGNTLRIVKNHGTTGVGDLDPALAAVSVSEATLGNYYSIVVKTFNNLIHAEIRNSDGTIVASLDHYSNEFNALEGTYNVISYNHGEQYRNIKAAPLTKYTQIIGFGDSNTYGERLANKPNEAYPGQINTLMQEKSGSAINKGINGQTSTTLLGRVSTDIYANKVIGARNIVVVYIGTNDFGGAGDSYSSRFTTLKNNIESLRTGFEANGFEMWLVTFPICNEKTPDTDGIIGQGRNPGLRAYNNWVVNDYYGIQNKVPVVIDYATEAQHPTLTDNLKPEHLADDELHASVFGHKWVATKIVKSL